MTPTPESATASTATPRPRRRRWLLRLFIVAGAIGLVALFHATLLRWLAFGLMVDGYDGPSDAVVLVGGNGPFAGIPVEEAARQYQQKNVHHVVVIENRSARTVRLGIVPTLEAVVRRELQARDVPAEAITVLPVTIADGNGAARSLQQWLEDYPNSTATVLCDELASRRTVATLRQTLAPAAMERVRFQPLADRRFGPDTWWRSRQGTVALLSEYVSLAYTVAAGDEETPTPWDPDQYEQSLTGR